MSISKDGSPALVQCGVDRSNAAGPMDLHPVLAALASALVHDSDRDLRGVFEEEMQRALPCRTVRLREIPARYQARLVTPTRTADSIVLGVASADAGVQAVLEASCDPAHHLSAADHEVLAVAANLGALVLEASRARTRLRGRPG